MEGKIERLKGELTEARSQAQGLQEELDVVYANFGNSHSCSAELSEENQKLQVELAEARSALSAVIAPEAADLLNQLKARRKRSAATLADVEAILEMVGG
ncbi:hypothetical protein PN499_05425 [Kamptonema animale CS-326]|uniref:hypothetical protein n=1 Tax=Kamptonema animale TaxID=92934 RepID=UPI00233142A5|nr:hypothetical protein [Kamptonema animale]MDB9510617.1 hypothetical protein [Kamptonema animale CS-326]